MNQELTAVLTRHMSHFAPNATANIKGAPNYPNVKGVAYFWQTKWGVIFSAEVRGLPDPGGNCDWPVFALHIHEGGSCTGNAQDPFANAGQHYNPENCPHPAHAGDLPPLFSNQGFAWCAVLTDRFQVSQVAGKTLIIHSMRDDFTSQPSGDAGEKIACAVIQQIY